MFLRNAWYVAAWDKDIGRELKHVRMLGENIVVYRREDGQPVALEDACPHRKLPLSMGRLKGDEVECGYHGMTFDCSGACTKVPGTEKIPPAAKVRSYPAVERYGLVWLWMGDAALADQSKIFKVEHWGDPDWGINRGDGMTINCNYLYMTDNLLDPSHVAWVHPTSFGNAACEVEPLQVTVHDKGVIVHRWMKATDVAPFYAKFVRFQGLCDRKQHYEVHWPSHAIIKAIFTPEGTGGDGKPLHADVFLMDSYNFMTPVDADHTRYFWFQMRNFAAGDQAVSDLFAKSVRGAFEEDQVVLNAVQKGMAEKQTPHLDLKIDVGPLRFRKRLAEMITAEKQAMAVAAE